MTKAELVRAISEKTGVDQGSVLASVEGLMDVVMSALKRKENVYLRGFGTFDLKHRAEKTARNIKENTTIVVPAHDLPHFKPCKEFADSVASK